VDSLERDVLEVLRLVRSLKNSLVPINRVPPEVLSLLPDYCDEDRDQTSITLTHVCRSWRGTFISRSSLWTRFDFTNIEKTRTYIKRSGSSPLNLSLDGEEAIHDVLPLIIPCVRRLKSLSTRSEYTLPSVLAHFRYHAPLLEKLDIRVSTRNDQVFDGALFGRDLSSLRELHLGRVITDFPWNNLANLRVVSLESFSHRYGTTQILDFFESAPLLHTISLRYRIPDPSDALPERIVPLRHLRTFSTNTSSSHPLSLHRHLHIPIGASFISEFRYHGWEPPLLGYLREGSPNFSNLLSHITMINLQFNSVEKFVRLSGPSGSLRVLIRWKEQEMGFLSDVIDSNILRSLSHPMLLTIRRLAISQHTCLRPRNVEEYPIFQTLSSTTSLRTLILIDCENLPFILALDPEHNQPNLVLCPNMEELIFYFNYWHKIPVEDILSMVKNRASSGAKLLSITLVSYREKMEEVPELAEHVTYVEYRVRRGTPAWDGVPGEGDVSV
jgi:hypothetical protein